MSASLTTSSVEPGLPLITSVTNPTDVASKISSITTEKTNTITKTTSSVEPELILLERVKYIIRTGDESSKMQDPETKSEITRTDSTRVSSINVEKSLSKQTRQTDSVNKRSGKMQDSSSTKTLLNTGKEKSDNKSNWNRQTTTLRVDISNRQSSNIIYIRENSPESSKPSHDRPIRSQSRLSPP